MDTTQIKFLTPEELVEQGIVSCATKSLVHTTDPKTGRKIMANQSAMNKEELIECITKGYSIVCAAEVPITVMGEESKMYLFVQNTKGRARIGCINARNINAGTTHKHAGIWWRSYNLGTRDDRVNVNLAFSHLLLSNAILETCYHHAATEYGLTGGITEAAMDADID